MLALPEGIAKMFEKLLTEAIVNLAEGSGEDLDFLSSDDDLSDHVDALNNHFARRKIGVKIKQLADTGGDYTAYSVHHKGRSLGQFGLDWKDGAGDLVYSVNSRLKDAGTGIHVNARDAGGQGLYVKAFKK